MERDFYQFVIDPQSTIKSAMILMTNNHCSNLIVCDDKLGLKGLISDGDIRRALIDEVLVTTAVDKVMNTAPMSAESVEQAKKMIEDKSLMLCPCVSSSGELTSFVLDQGGDLVVYEPEAQKGGADDKAKKIHAVAVIPARGGSRRVPRKNLAKVGEHSLLEWAIRAAQNSELIENLIVSTDDQEIADAAKMCGVDVPWLRPEELSTDTSGTLEVLIHAMNWASENFENPPEYCVLLEPTAPLRLPEHIDQALRLIDAHPEADSVVSVCEVPHVFNPEEHLVIEKDQIRPYVEGRTMDTRKLRGGQQKTYINSGLVYVIRTSLLTEKKRLYGDTCLPLVIDWKYYMDIDTQEDLRLAQLKMQLHEVPESLERAGEK